MHKKGLLKTLRLKWPSSPSCRLSPLPINLQRKDHSMPWLQPARPIAILFGSLHYSALLNQRPHEMAVIPSRTAHFILSTHPESVHGFTGSQLVTDAIPACLLSASRPKAVLRTDRCTCSPQLCTRRFLDLSAFDKPLLNLSGDGPEYPMRKG